jgi:hypothetical protein
MINRLHPIKVKKNGGQGFMGSSQVAEGYIDPNDAKPGGLQSQGVKGEVRLGGLTTVRRRRNNAGSEVLRPSRRVNNMAK